MKSQTKLVTRRGIGVRDISPVAMTIVVFSMVAAVGVLILANFKTTSSSSTLYECPNSTVHSGGTCCPQGYLVNASDATRCLNDSWPAANDSLAAAVPSSNINTTVDYGISGLSELTSWTQTIALVVAAVIIIGLVMLIRTRNI